MVRGSRAVGAGKALLALIALLLGACLPSVPGAPAPARPALVEDVPAARQLLEQERTAVRLASGESPAWRVLRLAELGLFQDADSLLARSQPRTVELVAAEATLRFRQYRFDDARGLTEAVLAQQPGNRSVRRLSVELAIAAGQLERATELVAPLLARGRRDAAAAGLLGRIQLIRRDPAAATEWWERARAWAPGDASGWLLEAQGELQRGDPARAEAAVRHALAVDPLDADARYLFASLLLQRGDSSRGEAATEQLRFAVELDPLHVGAHHLLGRTPIVGSASAPALPADERVAAALSRADSLLVEGSLETAIAHTRAVEAEFPDSPLPRMWRASLWHRRTLQGEAALLDSAQAGFRTVLASSPGSRAAHRGVAAVLGARQSRALAASDSLEAALARIAPPYLSSLHDVFPGLATLAGERGTRLVADRLGPLTAYLPLLARQGAQLTVLPLHRNPVGSRGARSSTLAGIGPALDFSGSHRTRTPSVRVGVEALERHSPEPRSQLIREFTRLVYLQVLTGEERRRVHELFLAAEERLSAGKGNGGVVGPEEFLAHAIDAYRNDTGIAPAAAPRPATREELLADEPDTFAFVEVLFERLARSGAGDPGALRSNWAEVYVRLAREAHSAPTPGDAGTDGAAALLDSALVRDPRYLPALVEYAAVESDRGRFERAEDWLASAEGISAGAAAVLAARAALLGGFDASDIGVAETRLSLLRRAIEAEDDAILRAYLARDMWRLYEDLGRLADAVIVAQERAEAIPPGSPALAEIRTRTTDDLMRMRLRAGYAEQSVSYFAARVAAEPTDIALRSLYADALAMRGMTPEAIDVLDEAAHDSAPVHLRLAELRLASGDSAGAGEHIDRLLRLDVRPRSVDGRLVRLLVSLGQSTEAQRQLSLLPAAREPRERAELEFTRGWISEWRGDVESAERLYREALRLDPYLLEARAAVIRLLRGLGREIEAGQVQDEAAMLALPAGPGFAVALQRRS